VNPALGHVALSVGAAAAATGAVTAGLGAARGDLRLGRVARGFVWLVLAAAVAAVAVMERALLTHDFSLAYVAGNGSRETPTLFTVASLWAALQGSILLWTLILALHLGLAVFLWRHRAADPAIGWATAVGLALAAFFFALVLGPADPFRHVTGAVPLDGAGPNPLLQNHPMMAFHPPVLYLGYVGFTVPFALGMGALISGRVDEQWLRLTRQGALLAWGCLTTGIVLGAWWSYQVLGWGGYWSWDPVENAALLPWLTATAYLHSVRIQERRGMLRVWNLSLLLATYCLTIVGTFLTRSGVVASVHAFSRSSVGPVLLGYLAVLAVAGLALLAWRGDRLRAPGRIDSPLSREAAFLVNNLVFTALAVVVLTGTVFPLLADALWGRQLSVGAPYFDRLGAPLGLTLLLLMLVAPLLAHRATDARQLRERLVGPALAAAASVAAATVAGMRGLERVAAVGLAGAVAWSLGAQVTAQVRARARAHAERHVVALGRLATGNRRRYGGFVVHLGVALVALALAASYGGGARREVVLAQGASATLEGYTVTYEGTRTRETPQKTTMSAQLLVTRNGERLGVATPSLSVFPGATEAVGSPWVRARLTEDLYLTLVSSPNESGQVTVGVFVTPLVSLLWVGGLVMAAGTAWAAWPARRRRPVSDPAPDPAPDPARGSAPGPSRARPARTPRADAVPVGSRR
jgi:cytochrome c-type biogenesis protein CcmF